MRIEIAYFPSDLRDTMKRRATHITRVGDIITLNKIVKHYAYETTSTAHLLIEGHSVAVFQRDGDEWRECAE